MNYDRTALRPRGQRRISPPARRPFDLDALAPIAATIGPTVAEVATPLGDTGYVAPPAFGYRPFSFHIAGTLVGCSVPPSAGEVWTWMIYNFVVFAVAPYVWFRRHYSATQLNLRSTNVPNDLLVIVAVAMLLAL